MQSSSRQRLGLLACAFDASGQEVLDALADTPGLPHAHIHSYHVAKQDGGGPFTWFRRDQEGGWHAGEWSSSAGTLARGLEAAVQDTLDVNRWRIRNGGIDLLDLVLLSPVPPQEEEERGFALLTADVLAALRSLRRRFRKIGRILLLVDGRFEIFGEGAPPGVLRLLPHADGSDGGLFDLVILMDRVNLEGMVVNDREEARKQTAAILAHLTVGELAPVLYRRIQAEKARLGDAGRYVALGRAEWRLTRERGVEATSMLLYRRMAGRLLPSNGSSPDEPVVPPPDPWAEEVTEALLQDPERGKDFPQEDPYSLVEEWDRKGQESLRTALLSSGWNLSLLEPFLKQRLAVLERLQNQAILKVATFMDPKFASWFIRKYLHKPKAVAAEPVRFEEVLLPGKKIACGLLSLACLGAIGVALKTTYTVEGSILAAAFGLGAIVLAATGFKRRIPRSVPESIPQDQPSELQPELEYRRNRSWVAKELASRCARALESWRNCRVQLRRAESSFAADGMGSFPFSPEVCSSLLEERALDAAAILHRFWDEEPTALAAILGTDEQSLPELLSSFSRRCCEPFGDLEWSDLFRAIGGESGLGDPAWREALEKARASALPWLPVAGSSLQTFLALPRSLSVELRNAFSRQFPDQKVVEEIDGDEILVLQLSQGYRLPEAS
jgi:hypothetical protein